MIRLITPQVLGLLVAPSLLVLAFAAAAAQIPAPDDVAAPPDDAETTASGLAFKVIEVGTGSDHPSATDEVTVHYSGWLTNGTMFDSSVAGGAPLTFPLDRVIAGWTEGVQLMVVGEKRRFWIPSELGYGSREAAGGLIPANSMLVFDVELLSIK